MIMVMKPHSFEGGQENISTHTNSNLILSYLICLFFCSILSLHYLLVLNPVGISRIRSLRRVVPGIYEHGFICYSPRFCLYELARSNVFVFSLTLPKSICDATPNSQQSHTLVPKPSSRPMPPPPQIIDWLNRTYPKPRVDPVHSLNLHFIPY
jgi:hypothetical protein